MAVAVHVKAASPAVMFSTHPHEMSSGSLAFISCYQLNYYAKLCIAMSGSAYHVWSSDSHTSVTVRYDSTAVDEV